MTLVNLYRPDVEEETLAPGTLADRALPADGFRLVLIDNGKPNAREELQYIAVELGTRVKIDSVEVVSKPSAASPLASDEVERVAERADLVIAGLGDCGGCSCCSLHDALQFERLGVPATVVISDAFVGIVGRLAEQLGFPGYHTIVVPHPIASKDDAWLRKLARERADLALSHLVRAEQHELTTA